MARAYPHITDVVQRFAQYSFERIHELSGVISDAESTQAMFEELKGQKFVMAQFRRYCTYQVKEYKAIARAAEAERALLEGARTFLAFCQRCNGGGKIRELVAQDESIVHKCPDCNGRGVMYEAVRS